MHLLRGKLDLSIVVIAYNMTRELPRTLRSLSRTYQRDVAGLDYEVVLVDNGSSEPLPASVVAAIDPRFRVVHGDGASASPAGAANLGVRASSSRNIGLVLDGARMVTPGVIAQGMRALRAFPRPIVSTPAWHLGHEHQSISMSKGYGPAEEDMLLADIGWPTDGYGLFDIAALAGSNPDGVFGTLNESCFLMVPRPLWNEVGGMDEAFDLPGGGLVNLDLFTRLNALPGSNLVILLGEGSFHQVHGGASTTSDVDRTSWYGQYEALRGVPYVRPPITPSYIGTLPERARRFAFA